jgi:hypothetical protein
VDIFECEDLVFSVIEWLGPIHATLLQQISTCFLRTIRIHFFHFPAPRLKNFCSSMNLLNWAMEEGGCPQQLCTPEHVARGAAEAGSIDVLQWAVLQDPTILSLKTGICSSAARRGHLHVLQWLRAQDPPCPWNENTCYDAAQGGHLLVLQWVRAQDPLCPWSEESCYLAAGGGHLYVLQWLRAQDPPCPWSANSCYMAAKGGHLLVLQ